MVFFCQENDERSVLLPLNMTSCQMSLKAILISSANVVKIDSPYAELCLINYCFLCSYRGRGTSRIFYTPTIIENSDR